MKKQKISNQTSSNYEANFTKSDEIIDYDEYASQKAKVEKELSDTAEVDKTFADKRRNARSRIAITPEKEKLAREALKETPLEKNDKKAMIIAAFLTFGLPAFIIVALVIGIAALVLNFFGR